MAKNRRGSDSSRNWWTIAGIAAIVLALLLTGFAAVTAATRDDSTKTASTYEAPPPAPPRPAAVILGDSYTEGAGAGGVQFRYAKLLANKMCWSVKTNGQGGTGYEAVGQPSENEGPYGTRVDDVIGARPGIVLVQGSTNDAGGQSTESAAENVLRRLRDGLPGVPIIAVGPAAPPAVSIGRVTASRDSVRAAADAVGVPFLDAFTWIDATNSALWAADGVHPSPDGHALFATGLANAVKQLGTLPTTCTA